MKPIFFFAACVLFFGTACTQETIDNATADSILRANAQRLPRTYKVYEQLKQDPLVKNFIFIRNERGGPGAASADGAIKLNLAFIEKQVPNFDDSRIAIVLYHELGHLYYMNAHEPSQRNRADNEKFAFEYSLTKAKEMADKGDCEPLQTGLKFMQQRSQSDNINDAHVVALKKLVITPLFASLVEFAGKCR